MFKTVVIAGGCGFIGRHLACYILGNAIAEKVIALDLKEVDEADCTDSMLACFSSNAWSFRSCDVRKTIEFEEEDVDLVVNLAAIHREPGHENVEYYETNLLGAENVCAWAEKVCCETIVFTSSISPYGPTVEYKTESSLPNPVTAYGGSKLVAEKIHGIWQMADPDTPRLLILRPGVVFGPGEGGNVSRLVRAVLGGYFVFMGNQETRKAGCYVKELCASIFWALDRQSSERSVTLYNVTMSPAPSMNDYVSVIREVAGKKGHIFHLPYAFILLVAYVLNPVLGVFGNSTLSPVRVRKLVNSTNIRPGYLLENHYPYQYDLDSALEDWKREMPSEWLS